MGTSSATDQTGIPGLLIRDLVFQGQGWKIMASRPDVDAPRWLPPLAYGSYSPDQPLKPPRLDRSRSWHRVWKNVALNFPQMPRKKSFSRLVPIETGSDLLRSTHRILFNFHVHLSLECLTSVASPQRTPLRYQNHQSQNNWRLTTKWMPEKMKPEKVFLQRT